jgi:hypothetical protein
MRLWHPHKIIRQSVDHFGLPASNAAAVGFTLKAPSTDNILGAYTLIDDILVVLVPTELLNRQVLKGRYRHIFSDGWSIIQVDWLSALVEKLVVQSPVQLWTYSFNIVKNVLLKGFKGQLNLI